MSGRGLVECERELAGCLRQLERERNFSEHVHGSLAARLRDARAEDSRRRLRAHVAGDAGALVEALCDALPDISFTEHGTLTMVSSTGLREGPDHQEGRVPKWAIEAALWYILKAHGVKVTRGIPLPRRGALGRWITRIQYELRDYDIHRAVEGELAKARPGLMAASGKPGRPRLEDARFEVAQHAGVPEDTIRKADLRARRRLRGDPRRYQVLRPLIASLIARTPKPAQRRRAAK